MIVRALSIRQPWAALITSGAKDIENRSWPTHFRGPLLIHASKGCTRAEYESALTFTESFTDLAPALFPRFEQLARGGIVGAVRLTGLAHPDASGGPWHVPGCWGFQLREQVPLPFRPLKGALGFFRVELTDAEADRLRAARLAA